MKLHLDIETYSSENLKKTTVYRYCESPDFEILMIGFAYEDNPVQVIDLAAGEPIPEHLIEALGDSETVLCAHNAAFERTCFNAIGLKTDICKWECTMVHSAYCGFPLGLDEAAEAMGLSHTKDPKGKALIRYFCQPVKPSKANDHNRRNSWQQDPEKWQEFKDYCARDVEAERAIDKHLAAYPVPKAERDLYILDQQINDNGIRIDLPFVRSAIKTDTIQSRETAREIKEITGIENPNSPAQLKDWLSEAMGREIGTLAKDEIPKLIEEAGPGAIRNVLKLRQRAAKTSIKKYLAMLSCVCGDARARGLFQFYGAFRTGRWAGRRIQLQNLPKIKLGDIDTAREIVSTGDHDLISMFYDRVSDTLSQLIRTAFVAQEGDLFFVSDFSAIEARVIAWLAGEQWRLDVFNSHGMIYEASASMMFGVPVEAVTKASDYRAKGKIAELALGYQGSVGALKKMGGEEMGLSEAEMQRIVDLWRAKNPNIVKLWGMVNKAAIACIQARRPVRLKGYQNLRFDYDGKAMTIELPSGRKLFYQAARLAPNKFDNLSVYYKGLDANNRWVWIPSYGGKFVENIVQAIARDLLAEAMFRLDQNGYKIVLHVHDEIALELEDLSFDEQAHAADWTNADILAEVERIMGEPVPWAEGLPLSAEGYVSSYYKKD